MKRLTFAALAFLAVAIAAPTQAQTTAREPVSHDTAPRLSKPDSNVMTIQAAPTFQVASVREIKGVDTPLLDRTAPLIALPFLLPFLIGAVKTVVSDKDGPFSLATPNGHGGMLNALIGDFYYFTQNKIIAATAATWPVCATGTTTSKIKTTNATVVLNGGAVNAVAATDDALVLTGGNLATGFTRKYLLLVSSADAFTVLASDDQAVAANCRFANRPADGLCIIGIVTITNASGADFVPGTTLLGAAGLTVSYIDGYSDLPYQSKIVLPN